jgi:hypothetical protein
MRVLALAGWGIVALVVGTSLALVEVFWLPLRVGGVLVPVSVVAAVVGNLLVVAQAYRWSRSRVVAVLPALAWLAVALAATRRRPEGDLVIVGTGALGYVGLAFLLIGVVAAAFAVGRVLAAPRRPRDHEGSGASR